MDNPVWKDFLRRWQGKTLAVLGLGVSNRPLVRLLLEAGCTVLGCDRAEREHLAPEALELERLGCRLKLGPDYLENLQADVVFRTPGLHPDTPALAALRNRGAAVTTEMDVFFACCPCTVLAVTGSDGKTTTTTLIAEMLKASGKTVWVGGNIGAPLLPRLGQMKPEDYAVVELSSFQLLDMTHSPHIAVLTNLAPNHLDVHKDMAEYVAAKTNIFRYQTEQDILIVNADNPITAAFRGPGVTRTFSRLGEGDGCLRQGMLCRGEIPVVAASDIRIPGEHNVENYLAALLAVDGLADDEAVRTVARTFPGVEHRIELAAEKDGVRWFNDSIASSPSRTIAGLRSFPGKVRLIAGGYDKHIPYDVLGPEICRHVEKLYLNGATAGKIRAAVEAAPEYRPGFPEIVDCGDLDSAVRAAAADAGEGDTVLLSPASAAFDQFPNFMVRGEHFKTLVKELTK